MFSSHHEYAYDLEDLGKHYKLYSSLMDYWNKVLEKNIYNIKYEDLVTNIDLETRSLLSFCNYIMNRSSEAVIVYQFPNTQGQRSYSVT